LCCLHLQIRRRNDKEIGGLLLVGIMLGLPFYLKMEAMCFSEISVDLIASLYVAEDKNLRDIGYSIS
jgi:hypothetical protein